MRRVEELRRGARCGGLVQSLGAGEEARPGGTLLSIHLRGQVNVPGMAALFATPEQVRQVAAAQLEPLLERPLAARAEPAAREPVAATVSVEELDAKLRVLGALLQRGLIDEADFARKKAELLARLG